MTRNEAAQKAHEHTVLMNKLHKDEINHCVANSIIYDSHSDFSGIEAPKIGRSDLYVSPEDSVSAACRLNKEEGGKTAILNFASYKYPGGQFLSGSFAQEESLCHESILFNVLSEFPDYYNWNNAHKNRSLYMNRALYSPDILFCPEGEDEFTCDVITCAAPNLNPYYKYGNCSLTLEENSEVLDSRIRFILKIAADNHVNNLVFGAWGCGVFMQDPYEVSRLFLKNIKKYGYDIANYTFAIPGAESKNHIAFISTFFEK